MKRFFYLIAGFIIINLSSCSEDFVNIPPENFLNTEEFYQSESDFNSAVIATYSKLQGQVGIYFELVEWRSDNLDLLSPTAGTQDRFNINKFQETSANGIIQNAWANFYNGIFRCNQVISNIPNANFDEQVQNQFEAEAKFIRALTYFNIVRFWGDAPIILSPVSPEEALTIGRSPIADVYEVIEQDLLFAIENLPSSYPPQSFGRATLGAARSLLGKVYLTQGRYSECITTLNQVIGQYQLLNDISDVFDPENEQNQEIIFSIRFNKDIQGEGHGLWFAVTDISISPITSKLSSAYQSDDERLPLISYQQVDNRLAPGKFVDEQSEETRTFGNDYILMRYADVLLMYAEALNAQGYQSEGEALSRLNQVRERAGLNLYTATDLPDQSSFQDAVLLERFLELPLEGHRWFDLIRANAAANEISTGIGETIQEFQLLYPIPQSEIEKINNSEIFYQNEGY